VRDPVQWNQTVAANGSGWENLLGYIGQVRADDQAPFDAYYYGIFSPSSSANNYCGQGCVAGLGNIGGSNDAYSRAAIGLGFPGEIATETAVHELGHTHGRFHAPCGGAAGTDQNFPYDGASIGAWGYDVVTQKLLSPENTVDLMSYCSPIWVSDYTFTAFWKRMKAVNSAAIAVPEEMKNRTYDRARVDGEGQMHWLSPVKLELPPSADPVDVTVESDAGLSAVMGHYYPYDHLPGGVILWPQVGGPTTSVVVDVEGKTAALSAE
jgi:Peptidase M66